jgi:hypothetical protein
MQSADRRKPLYFPEFPHRVKNGPLSSAWDDTLPSSTISAHRLNFLQPPSKVWSPFNLPTGFAPDPTGA